MIGFALRADYADTFQGGVLSIAGVRAFDVAAALEEGNGIIVVPDTELVLLNALDAYPALKRVPVEDGAQPNATRYDRMLMPELRAQAERLGMDVHGSIKKDALRAALIERDRRVDDGDHDLLANPPGIAEDGTLIVHDAAGDAGATA